MGRNVDADQRRLSPRDRAFRWVRRGPTNDRKDSEPPISFGDKMDDLSRRGLIWDTLLLGMASTFVAADRTAALAESLFDNSRTTISPIRGERLLPSTDSIVIDLPGQNYAIDQNIEAVPALSKLGVRTKADLGNRGDIVPALINDLYSIQDATRLKKMSFLCDSDSWPIAAQVIQAVNHRIATQFVFLASTPENISDIRGFIGSVAKEYATSGYGPSAALNEIVQDIQFGYPLAQYINPDAASAKIAYEEIEEEYESDIITRRFARFLTRYNHAHPTQQMRMAYLMLQTPSNDTLVDEVASVNAFSHILPLDVLLIGGSNQSHDNITGNAYWYNLALRNYLAGSK